MANLVPLKMLNEAGSAALVPSTYSDAPKDQAPSSLISSPAPVGILLICNVAWVTEVDETNLAEAGRSYRAPNQIGALEVTGVVVVDRTSDLERTPRLIDADVPAKSGTVVPG
jgi:hypothetical protein